MRKLLPLFIFVFFNLQFAFSQCTIDQSQLFTDGGTSERNLPGYYDGQTFTAGNDGLLCEIDLLMFNTMTGTMTLNIYSGSGIAGPLLTTQVVNVYVPSGQVWQNWTIASPPVVKNDSVYTFQFVPIQGGGLPDPYGVNIQGSDVYAGGYDLTLPQFDMTFKTYVDGTSGISENNSSSGNLSVYPNPSHDKLTVSFNGESEIRNWELGIFDVTEREVYGEKVTHKSTIINHPFTPGIYFVKLKNLAGDEKGVQKLIIQ